MIFCRSLGTFLSANFPLTMLLDARGPSGWASRTPQWPARAGMGGPAPSPHTSRLLAIHMSAMIGPSSSASDRHSFCRYRLGSCTPASTSCTPNTSRLKASVMAFRLASEPAYSRGFTRFAACGEKMTPATREITGTWVLEVIFKSRPG